MYSISTRRKWLERLVISTLRNEMDLTSESDAPFFSCCIMRYFCKQNLIPQCAKRYVQHSKVVKKATSKPDSHVQGHKSTREVHFANWIVPPLSASNDSLGFHKVFPRWLPFIFPYSSAGSLAICPTLGRRYLTTCRYGCLWCIIWSSFGYGS